MKMTASVDNPEEHPCGENYQTRLFPKAPTMLRGIDIVSCSVTLCLPLHTASWVRTVSAWDRHHV
jgi:hypothetical protein